MKEGRARGRNARGPTLVLVATVALLSFLQAMISVPFASASTWVETTPTDFAGGTFHDVVATPEGDLQLSPNGTGFEKTGIVIANGPPGSPDSEWARDPTVLVESDGTYRMWYRGSDGSQWRILLATSPDGTTWTKEGSVLDTFPTVGAPFVRREGSTYHMWFQGGPSGGGSIYHASSPDGRAWTVEGIALAPGPAGAWDGVTVGTPWVVWTGSAYLLYYTGSEGNADRIGVASSNTYTNFTRMFGTPVLDLGPPGGWDGFLVRFPAVFPGDPWLMYYAGRDSSVFRIGLATSADGLAWSRAGNPLFGPDPYPSWDYGGTVGATIVNGSAGRRMYFTGSNGLSVKIGLAEEAPAHSSFGVYESRVFDSGAAATTWQSLTYQATTPYNTAVFAVVRSGDTAEPDPSWSAGSVPDPFTGALDVPRARYVQYALLLSTFEPVKTPTVHEVTVVYEPNRGPAAVSLSPANQIWTADASPLLEWTPSDPEGDGQMAFRVELSSDPAFGTITHSSGDVSSASPRWQAPNLAEGTWHWRVQLFDGTTWGPWVEASFGIDTSPPALSVATPAQSRVLGSKLVDVTWTANDPFSGLARFELRFDNAPTVGLDRDARSYLLAGVDDGEHAVVLSAFDEMGHTTVVTVSFVVDTVDPSARITSPGLDAVLTTGRIDLLWEAGGTGSGIDHFDLSLDGGTPIVLDGSTRSYTLAGVADGAHVVTLKAVDEAGNSVTALVRVRVDSFVFSLSGPYGPWPTSALVLLAILAAAFFGFSTIRRRRSRNSKPPPPM